MPVYYTKQITGREAVLDEEESRHCIKVARLEKDDRISVVDGEGNLYRASIATPDPKSCRITITEHIPEYLKRDYYLHIAIAPPKSADRFECFLEKATEIGVDEITPLICERSERRKIRMERSLKILISAMKQSGRASLPKLNPQAEFDTLIREEWNGRKVIAHCRADTEKYCGRLGREISNWLVLIGPEGDFSPSELSRAGEAGFEETSLGDAVLRTETAGIAACQLIGHLYRL